MAESGASRSVLRFAVAMRGGVSLAVWIGGAFFELDRLRRNDDAFTQALLGITRFRAVEVDILTGASAGGLNAAVGGLAISRGVAPSLQATWMENADIDKLLRWSGATEGRPHPKARRSILNGDYFMEQIVGRLDETATSDRKRIQPRPVQMFLAATVFGGVLVTDPREPALAEKRHEAYFHFRHLARPEAFSDLVDPDIASSLGAAARSTASFPAAFEPQTILPTMFKGRINLPHAEVVPGSIKLYDGGVVDNIPVARAIRASATAPAVESVRRWVLFLHPSPSTDPAAPTPAPAAGLTPSVPAVVGDVVASKTTESLLDDLDVLRLHNRDAESQVLQRQSACAAALAGGNLAQRAAQADALLASVDADWLYGLLVDPASTLPWIPIGRDAPASPLQEATPDQRFAERMCLLETLIERTSTLRPYARLARIAHLTIDWIRWMEEGSSREFADERRVTYDVLLLAELTEAALCRRFIGAGPDRIARLEDALARVEGSGRFEALAAMVGTYDPATDDKALPLVERLKCGPQRTLTTLAKGCVPSGGTRRGTAAVSQVLLAKLAGVGVTLRTTPLNPGHGGKPSLWTLLNDALVEPSAEDVQRAFFAVDAACAGLHRGRLGGVPRTLEYARISGAQPSPLVGGPTAPEKLPKVAGISFGDDGTIDPKTKLAGGRLANFSAFLSPRFRANDWMWGRMDAAAGLVEILLRADYLSQDPEHLLERVGAVVEAPFEEHDDVPPALTQSAELVCEDLWAQNREKICGELIEARGLPRRSDASPDVLATVRALITARWQLELFIGDVAKVVKTPLDGEPSGRLPKMSMPASARDARINLEEAMTAYQGASRSAGALWGRRRTTALGVRTARHVGHAVAPSPIVRLALAPFLMAAVGALLLRGAFLVSWALLVNVVLVPRLTHSGRMAVVLVSAVGQLGFWLFFVKRATWTWRALVSGIVALAASASGVAAVCGVKWAGFRPPKPHEATSLWKLLASVDGDLAVSMVTVGLAAAVATALLWLWAKWFWTAALSVVAGLTMAFWDLLGSWKHPTPQGRLATILGAAGSMWIGAIALVLLAATLAMLLEPEDR